MKILVTGSAGFIGSWISEALLEEGHVVFGVDDLSTGSLDNIQHLLDKDNFHFYQGDLRDLGYTQYIFAYNKGFDIIYHLAANAREGASFYQPQSVISRNTGAYTNTLTEGIKHGMKKMILFSSIAVYGENDVPYTEQMLPMPVDIYGLQKYNMERMTEMLAAVHGFEFVIFRPHNLFGERQAINDIHRNVLAIWMNQIMRNEPTTVYGNGMQQRAFSYIGDSLHCYIRALELQGNRTFNIGSSNKYTIDLAQEAVCQSMGVTSDYPIKQLADRHGEIKHAYSNVSKAEQELGLESATFDDFVKAVEKMATWAMQQGPQAWKTTDPIELPTKEMPSIWR